MRSFSLSLLLLAGITASAAAQATAGPRAPDPSWMSWNAETRTTTFKLIGGLTGTGAKSPFNFNGYTDGEFTLSVPVGSNVVVNFINDDGTPHSAEVIADKKPLPNMSDGQPALPRAYTRNALEGLAQGQGDNMRFVASPAGDYLFFCGVPGHGLSGMWIRLKVTADSAAPKMSVAGQ
jgi:sulfocyanin